MAEQSVIFSTPEIPIIGFEIQAQREQVNTFCKN